MSNLRMSLSLDLDNKWSYLKTHGNDAWKDYPTYLPMVVPRILQFLERENLEITFFVVGQDAALDRNREAFSQLGESRHELACHSFSHEPWLHLYTEEQLHEELDKAEQSILRATNRRVDGFRGPGFSLSPLTLRVLRERGYRYDATVFPNLLNPLARAYFFATSDLSAEEKRKRKALFGSYKDALRPVKPFQWEIGDDTLLEIPVSTMPLLKIPIHFSYLIYLAGYSFRLALAYLWVTIRFCRMTNTEPSLLLHPLDFLGHEDDEDLAFFPGMRTGRDRKDEILRKFFDRLLRHFEPVPMGRIADELVRDESLRSIELVTSG